MQISKYFPSDRTQLLPQVKDNDLSQVAGGSRLLDAEVQGSPLQGILR